MQKTVITVIHLQTVTITATGVTVVAQKIIILAGATVQVISADQCQQGLPAHLRFIHLLQDNLAKDRVQKTCHLIVHHIAHQNRQVRDRALLEEDHREDVKEVEYVLKTTIIKMQFICRIIELVK